MVGSRRDPDFSHEWNGVFVMGSILGILSIVGLVAGCIWAAKEGNGFGKDLANYQIAKRMREEELERRVKALESRK